MVYVLNKDGQPLMPTSRHGKVKHLLKDGKAVVVKRCPFTIKLTYDATKYTQEITLGVDAGSKTIGISATTKTKEVYAAEVTLRNDIVNNLSTRKEFRKARRNRKTRYRKVRFNNRKATKQPGWIAPSVQNKVDSHINVVNKIRGFIPITKIVIETASFDIQKIKALKTNKPVPVGTDYQQGDQLGFWNVREYVLFRDHHTCQCCKGKSKDKVLNVHHIESRKTGGNAPNNLITLCDYCHKQYHMGLIALPKNIKRGMKFANATFMGIMRWKCFDILKETNFDIPVEMTYGYITKNTRIKNNLPKEHYVDARCISGNPLAEPLESVHYYKKVRCHNRQIHKAKILKGSVRKRNQASYEVKGFRLYDKVKYNGKECFVFGRRSSGYFDLRLLDGTNVHKSASYKKLKLIELTKSYLVERRNSSPHMTKVTCLRTV